MTWNQVSYPHPMSLPSFSTKMWIRVLYSAGCLAASGTFLAVQLDFFRRHRPGIDPVKYWLPQLRHIWAPGLGFTVLLFLIAIVLERRARRG